MPKYITNVRVTKDDGTVYIDNASGNLYEDEKNDQNIYLIVRGGNRRNPLVKDELYTIKCDEKEVQKVYGFLSFRCAFEGDLAGFRLNLQLHYAQTSV